MARNKYPEETEKLIMDTAFNLFIKKGYDNTSIQDIIDNLGGLSKGAIYHYFKSKEDILLQIMDKMDSRINAELMQIRDDHSLNGYEKLLLLFKKSIFNTYKHTAFQTTPDLMKNPRMLVLQIESIYQEVVPDYMVPILTEGIADGSIQTDYPCELAEVMVLLSNLWLNPLMSTGENAETIMRRVEFYRLLFHNMGLDIIDDEMMEELRKLGEYCFEQLNKISGDFPTATGG